MMFEAGASTVLSLMSGPQTIADSALAMIMGVLLERPTVYTSSLRPLAMLLGTSSKAFLLLHHLLGVSVMGTTTLREINVYLS